MFLSPVFVWWNWIRHFSQTPQIFNQMIAIRGEKAAGKSFFHPLTMHHIMNWCGKWKLKRSKLNTIYFRLFTRRLWFDMIDLLMMPLKWLSTSFHRWMKNLWADGEPSTPIDCEASVKLQSVQNIDITVKLVWINNARNVIKNAKLLVGLVRKRKKGAGRGPFRQFIQHAYGYVNMQPVCSKQHVNSLWS